MHFKCPSGTSGSRQGLHEIGYRTSLPLQFQGPVTHGFVEPKMATSGTFNAEAICISPESFVINRSHRLISAMASPSSVFPAMLMAGDFILFFKSPPAARSRGDPNNTIRHPK